MAASHGPGPRILHLHSSFNLGGKEARSVRLMNAFGAHARHAILSAAPDELGARASIAKDIWAEFPQEGRAPALHGQPGAARYIGLARYMQGFDLVLSYNWGAMDGVMAHRLLGQFLPLPPLIHHEDGFNADEAKALNRRRTLFRRAALPTARAIVVPSVTLEGIARRHWGARLPLRRISNGIATARYARPEAGAIPGLVPDGQMITVGTIAGLRAVKDLPLLVEAVALAPRHVRLVIVGDGPERAAILAAAARAGIADRLLMPGFLPDPWRYAGLFDMVALSSHSEQQPIAVIEAMAAGLPVVAPMVGDVPAMVAELNRPFVVERDPRALGHAIATLAGDAGLRRAIGSANRARAATEYDEGRMIDAYAALYGDALGRPLIPERSKSRLRA